MPSNSREQQLRAKASLLVLCACLGGAAAAVGSTEPARAEATGGARAVAATYPRAGVILRSKLAAHSTPAGSSPTIKVLSQFRSDFRPTTLLVLGEAKDAKGLRWLKLSMPMRPNGRTGWVLATAVQTHPVHRSILIDLSSRKLRVVERGKTRLVTRLRHGRLQTEGALPRRLRLRDERLLEAFGVARRRCRRPPWHVGAMASRPGGVARLRSHVERVGARAQATHARGHAAPDRPVSTRTGAI
jgi:hypothetical protein